MSKKEMKERYDKIKKSLDKIEINIYTNIGDGNTTPTPFTRSIFATQPERIYGSLENYPFFTTEYPIPYTLLKKKSKEDIFSILFNKDNFTKFITKSTPTTISVLNQEAIDENIKSLLKLLFPTYYPTKENYTDTYTELIKEIPPTLNPNYFSLPSFGITSIFKSLTKPPTPPNVKPTEDPPPTEEESPDFTYLTIGGKIYTVLKVVYLNDFINNPKYNKVITAFTQYKLLTESFKEKTKWLEYETKQEILLKLFELIIEMNLPENKCKYYSSVISQYIYDRDTSKTVVFSSDSSIINNRTIKEVNNLFNLFFYNNENIDLFSQKHGFDSKQCISEYLSDSMKETELRALTPKQIIESDYTNPNLTELKERIKAINTITDDLKQKIIEIKEKRIYNSIIRGKPIAINDKLKYDDYKRFIDTQYKKYSDFFKGINPIFTNESSSNGRFSFPSVFTNKFSKISKLLSTVKSYEGSDKIDTGNASTELTDYIKKEYPKLSEFKELVKTFTYPNRESSNETFSNMVLDSIQITTQPREASVDLFIQFLKNILENKIDDKDKLHTGVDLYNIPDLVKPKYEIQVYMDLVEGKLTKDVLSKTECFFKDNGLVNLFNKLKDKDLFTNKYVFNSKLPVLKIPDITSILPKKKDILPINGGKTRKNITRRYKKRRRLNNSKLSRRRFNI